MLLTLAAHFSPSAHQRVDNNIFCAIRCNRLIHDALADTSVCASPAAFARGIDLVVWEPEPPCHLLRPGLTLVGNRVSTFFERNLTGTRQPDSQACLAGVTFHMRRFLSAYHGDFVVGGCGRETTGCTQWSAQSSRTKAELVGHPTWD